MADADNRELPAGSVGEAEIAEHIRTRVPESLIPAGAHILGTFPRTCSGKADRLHLSGLHGT